MKPHRFVLHLAMLGAFVAPAFAAGDAGSGYPLVEVTPGAAPASIRELVSLQAFRLEVPLTYTHTAERAAVTNGWIIVLRVDPALARVRNAMSPVLYAGRWPVARANHDPAGGIIVGIVPGQVDFARDPVFFGSEQLPERVTAERGREEVDAAIAAGYRAFDRDALDAALRAGGLEAVLPGEYELLAGPVAAAIERYSPAEAGRAAGYRSPRIDTR